MCISQQQLICKKYKITPVQAHATISATHLQGDIKHQHVSKYNVAHNQIMILQTTY